MKITIIEIAAKHIEFIKKAKANQQQSQNQNQNGYNNQQQSQNQNGYKQSATITKSKYL